MEKHHRKIILLKLIVPLILVFAALIIHSCKKDVKSTQPTDIVISQAKVWYESAYPVNSANGKLVTQSLNHDLSQWIKPDWQHTANYKRLGKNVIEMPIDPGAKFSSALKIGKSLFNKSYTRSYYLLLNDGKSYEA